MSGFKVYSFDNDDCDASSSGVLSEDETSATTSDSGNPGPKRRRGKQKVWEKLNQHAFQNADKAGKFIQQENCWSISRTNKTYWSTNVYYRCNHKSHDGSFCPAEIYLQHSTTDGQVSVFRTEDDHDHQDRAPASRGLSNEQKTWIRENFDLGLRTPSQIIQGMMKAGLPEPPKMKLNNFLQSFKESKFGKHKTVSLADIKAWCQQRAQWNQDLDVDSIFVSGYESGVSEGHECFFRFFVTSRRLLCIAAKSKIVHVDGTYKNVWEGYPVLVAGVTDKNRSFHPIGMAVCSSESTADYTFICAQVKAAIEREVSLTDSSFLFEPEVAMADAAESIKRALSIPDYLEKMPLGQKMKRGRPAKAKKPLLIQQ